MNKKFWIKIWFFLVLSLVILIAFLNYIIDPLGYNFSFHNSFNQIKIRINNKIDERLIKFNLIDSDDFNTYIFGSSRNTIINPSLIDKLLPNSHCINLAFSGASIDEIELYIDYLLKNKNIHTVFIPIDLFSFAPNNISNGVLPSELTGNNKYRIKEYFSIEMLKKTFITIYENKFVKHPSHEYYVKGMRYYDSYLNAIKNNTLDDYILENVINKEGRWRTDVISEDKISILKNLVKKLEEKNVKVYLFTNPIRIQQILKGNNYLVQIELLKRLIDNTSIQVYDFNNFNQVNFSSKYYIDTFHFNYGVADCIVNKILTGFSCCGESFGVKVNQDNLESYTQNLIEKLYSLK